MIYDSPKCQICKRDLENPESINRGIGPECIAKRERFLAAAGSSLAEIADLALCGDPTVTRWIAMVAKAIGAGRQDHVNRFIAAAADARIEILGKEPAACGHINTGCGDICNIRDGYGVDL